MIRFINRILAPTGYQFVPWIEIMARQAQFERTCDNIERMMKHGVTAVSSSVTDVEDGRWRVH